MSDFGEDEWGDHVEEVVFGGDASLVVVRVEGGEFGIPIEAVDEVLPHRRISRLPFPPPSIRGVISVRGDLFPVLDLAHRLFGTFVEPGRASRFVRVRDPVGRGPVALLVESVSGLAHAGAEMHAPPPEVAASLPPGWIRGVVSAGPDRAITILELEPVLAVREPETEVSR
jgi:purine-binding chemotaxis protein CheW